MKDTNKTRVTIQMDRDLKEAAARLFEDLGINMTSAVNVFLRKAVEENGIPFPVASASPRKMTSQAPKPEYPEKVFPAFRLEELAPEPAEAAVRDPAPAGPAKTAADPLPFAAVPVPKKSAPELSCPRMEIQKRLVRVPARSK